MNGIKKMISAPVSLAMLLSCCAIPASAESGQVVDIVLSDNAITVDGSVATDNEEDAVYTSHDIVYYEDRDTYDSGNLYGEGTDADKHSEEEALAHTVVNITEPGTYRISGELSLGQIAIDLGEEAKTDPEAVVTLILDNADVTCTVAPAVIFYNVYECDADWVAYDQGETEDYAASPVQDTAAAGANVILADGSVNNMEGSYVARIYKDNGNQKKLHKYDGAFYSKMSMNIDGEAEGTGVLNIVAENEGLDSELHLSINGGKVNIQSQDDGINTNEDGVSVTTINGGSLHIVAGLGTEGDGIDSNGYLMINGGTVISIANPISDSGLDSDMGSYVNGGTVLATGSTMDWAESDSNQVTMNLQFAASQGADEAIVVTDLDNNVLFAYDPDQDETTGSYNRSYLGAVLSCPSFAVGETYYVYVGGDVEGDQVDGLYDPSTVTSFTGAVRQTYTGTDVGMGGPGMGGPGMGGPGMGNFGGMTPPNGNWSPEGQGDNTTVNPDGTETFGPQRPDGEMPDGAMNGGELPEPPQGSGGEMTPPDGNMNGGQTGEASNLFYMTDKVNAFSGVQDEEGYQGGTVIVPGNEDDGPDDPDDPTPTVSFTDVEESDWYYSAVMACAGEGIITGYDDGTFQPGDSLTRGEAAALIVRASGVVYDASAKTTFSDATDNWASAYIAAAVEAGILDGYPDGTFQPDKPVTRAELVKMIVAAQGLTPEGSSTFTDCAGSWADSYLATAQKAGIVAGYEDGTFAPDQTIKRSEAAKMIYEGYLNA